MAQYGTTEVLDPGGTAFSKPTFINFASGFEAATKVRAHNLPIFAETIPFTHIQGTTIGGGGSHAAVSKGEASEEKAATFVSARSVIGYPYRLIVSCSSFNRAGDWFR